MPECALIAFTHIMFVRSEADAEVLEMLLLEYG